MISVVGFYTKNTPYEEEAVTMEASARGVGIEEVILYPMNSKGSWVKNCSLKPEVLLRACDDIKKPFLYVDVDARFQKYPSMLDFNWNHYGIGAHYFRDVELLSGTLWINPTPDVIRLLTLWQEACSVGDSKWDQKILQDIITNSYGIKQILRLPPEYTFIFDLSKKIYGPNVDPVITHHQASRKYRHKIK